MKLNYFTNKIFPFLNRYHDYKHQRIKSNLILMMHIGLYYFIKSDVNASYK